MSTFGTGFGTSTPAGSAFSFGAATSNAATPIKTGGFGTGNFGFSTPATTTTSLFGTPAATTSTSLFGTPATTTTSLFGQPAGQQTGFGAGTTFGTPAAGNTFGTPSAGFGVSSGTTTSTFQTPSTNFGFGSNTSGFGAPTSSTATFGLGSNAPTNTTTGFGTLGGFGATATTTSAPLFGNFTTTTSQPQSTFGLGTSLGGFGTGSLGSGLGTGLGTSLGTGLGSGFGGFGIKPATSTTNTGFGGFGTTGTSFSGFGSNLNQTQQQQQQQQPQANPNSISEALYNAVFNCQLFNDERDNTIARWNLIQALWGTGKAYYSANAPPIELNQENPLCRFKAIGYSRMPESDNNDGLIVLCFVKKEQELKDGKQQLTTSLSQILGNKPNLTVTIDNINSMGETKGQVTIFVTERGATGSVRKIPSNELSAYLMQAMQKQQLTQIGVENLFPQVKLDPAQIKEYMDNPPCSIDPRLWKQAQLDNPNPEKYIPVPMIGFQQVKHRLKCQEEETARHRAYLDMAAESIQSLQRQHTATQARLKEHRRTLLELQHRVLQVLVRQEITRKIGFSLQPEEEILTNRFEAMHSQISAPTQFKGRISEMLSQLRMRRHTDTQNQERYTMDPIAQDDIKQYLNMEQQGMGQLISTVNTDLESLKIIKDGMSELVTSHASTS